MAAFKSEYPADFIGICIDEAEEDVLAFMTFPKEHRAKIHSTDPLERLNGEIKRRTEVVGTFFLQRHLISRRTLCSFRAQAIAD